MVAVGDSVPSRQRRRDGEIFAGSCLSHARTPTTLVPPPESTEPVDLDDIDRRSVPVAVPPAEHSLEALLGTPRATLLRVLERPASAGAIAEALHATPSVASHHIATLERAGLARRERRGRHVLVWRTRRGAALLDLYGR